MVDSGKQRSTRQLHAPSFVHSGRVLCGKEIWGVLIVVRSPERVTCVRCKQRFRRVERMERENAMVKLNVGDLTPAEVIKRLWNEAQTGGNARLLGHDLPEHVMPLEEAQGIIDRMGPQQRWWFDWIQGRMVKVNMTAFPEIEVSLYDRDNGAGAAARALGMKP